MSLFSKSCNISYKKAFPLALRAPPIQAFSYYAKRNMASSTATTKPPLPPFTKETAQIKVKAAQDLWNTRSVLDVFSFLLFVLLRG
jgi:hypothetical protein